jgi:lipopolysaccharide transport system ATP-binding protein
VVGIIGHNGAGKSTLLKLLARISAPTSGRVKVSGRIAPLIEVGAGFVPDFTGRENLYLNGSILGMSKREIDRKFEEIVQFADIAAFIDTPVKRYSSGMQVRLAFSLATSADAEILIVDEVLAVGDLAFQRKCLDRMDEIAKRKDCTILVVSHNVRQLERFCSRVLLFERGQLVKDGKSADVCNEFFTKSNETIKTNQNSKTLDTVSDEVEIDELRFRGEGASNATSVVFGKSCELELKFKAKQTISRAHIGVVFHTTDMVFLSSFTNFGNEIDLEQKQHEVLIRIPRMSLLPGVYQVRVWIGNHLGRESFCTDGLLTFDVTTSDPWVAQQGAISFVDIPNTLLINGAQTVSVAEAT